MEWKFCVKREDLRRKKVAKHSEFSSVAKAIENQEKKLTMSSQFSGVSLGAMSDGYSNLMPFLLCHGVEYGKVFLFKYFWHGVAEASIIPICM